MEVRDQTTGEFIYENEVEEDTSLTEWTPGPLAPGAPYRFSLAAFAGDVDKFDSTSGNDSFESYALFASGNEINFSTTPIPEPATLLLLGSGLLGIVIRKRRK